MYRPSVVRIGLNPHHSVAHVALDALIDHRMSASRDAPVCPGLAEDAPRLTLSLRV